jgi:hypothetical protein
MKVGSLVQYVHNCYYVDMITPDRSEIYVVREVVIAISPERPIPHLGIRLDEIINNCDNNGREMCYVAEHFVELQPPIPEVLKELLNETITT